MSLGERQLRREMTALLQPVDPAPEALDRVHAAVRRRRRRTRGVSVAGAVVAVAATVLVVTTVVDPGPSVDTAPVGPPTPAPSPQEERLSPATDPYVFAQSRLSDLLYVDPASDTQRPLAKTSEPEYSPDLSPDGSQVAFVRLVDEQDSEIYLVNVDGSGERRLTDGPFTAGAPRWSPDGERIAYWRQTADGRAEIFVLDVSTGQERAVTPDDLAYTNPWWSSDGKSLFYYGNWVEELDLDSGERRTVPGLDSASPGATSPDESLIVIGAGSIDESGLTPGPLVVRDRSTGRTVWRSDAEFIEVQDLTWTDDEILVVHGLTQARATIVHVPALGPGPPPSASAPPRPAPVTMRAVRRIGSAQEFRSYSGPNPPPFSETDALQREASPNAHSLGLWDVGKVSEGEGTVEWHSVWVIASDTFVDDLNELNLGGPPSPSNEPTPQPGWIRSVTMLDATSGKFVLAYTF